MVLKKVARSKTSTYGVALSSLFVVHELNAEILPITWNGGLSSTLISAQNIAYSNSANPVDIDQLIGGDDLSVFLSYLSDRYGYQVFLNRSVGLLNAKISGVEFVSEGDTLDPAVFAPGSSELYFGYGSRFVGFKTTDGNVGWFRITQTFGKFSDAVALTSGEFANEGETITVGDKLLMGDINCDGAVNLLDVAPFIDLLSTGDFSPKADFDGDGAVTLLDNGPFVDAIIGN